MRLFLGLTEVAGFLENYARGFRALGHDTYAVAWRRHPLFPETRWDLVIDEPHGLANLEPDALRRGVPRLRRHAEGLRQAARVARTCDVAVFLFGTSLLPRFGDYPWLKRAGLKIVSVFLGSDIRYWRAHEADMERLGLADDLRPFLEYARQLPGNDLRSKQRIVDAAERHADLILSQAGYGQLQKRPYMRLNVPLDLSTLAFNVPGREVPKVLHLPSNRNVKGTREVLAAVATLRSQGLEFEFQLVENTPNEEVRRLLSDADILVDELFADTVGVLSSEGMATGNAVLTSYMPDYAKVPEGCPALNVRAATLAGHLRSVVVDRKLRADLASRGLDYVKRHNDHVAVARQILTWLSPGGIRAYDFDPAGGNRPPAGPPTNVVH